jgi:hypothetical protein
MRNKIEHYAVTINKQQAASIFVRTMAFLTWFFHDELQKDFHTEIGDANWQELMQEWTNQQMLDFLFTVGAYVTVAGVMRSTGVQRNANLLALAAEYGAP